MLPLLIIATPSIGIYALYYSAGVYYERLFPDYESKKLWVGKKTSELESIVGPIHWTRFETPKIINTKTRKVVRRLTPYKVSNHCPWPKMILPCPVGLEVFSHDDDIITRVRTPFEW
jgi:hypothetical protein